MDFQSLNWWKKAQLKKLACKLLHWSIGLQTKRKLLNRNKLKLRSSRKHRTHQSKPKKIWTNWEIRLRSVRKLQDAKPVTNPDTAVLKPWGSGSERPLEKLRTNLSTTYARKLRNVDWEQGNKLDGQAKSPSSVQSFLLRTLCSMSTTRSGGTMSTTSLASTSFCSWRLTTTVRRTKSMLVKLLMKSKPKRTKDLQLPCWTKKRRPAESEEGWVFENVSYLFSLIQTCMKQLSKLNLKYLSHTSLFLFFIQCPTALK